MKWILCGKNDAAVAALEYLVAQGDEVWAIATRGDRGEDGWQRSFAGAARRLGLRCDAPRRINAPETIAALAGFGARALISIQYDQILRDALFDAVDCPCLNLHYALLPRHRGVAPSAWAVLAGDSESGVTLHHMVEDIDAGDLVAQRRVPVGPEDTAREVYDAVSEAAARLFCESHPFGDELLETRLPQDPADAVYHKSGDFDFSKRRVDWTRPAPTLQRWLRAMIFPPMQYPEASVSGRSVEITRVGPAQESASEAAPGAILESGSEGVRVACGEGSLLVRELAEPGLLASLKAGDRFDRGGE